AFSFHAAALIHRKGVGSVSMVHREGCVPEVHMSHQLKSTPPARTVGRLAASLLVLVMTTLSFAQAHAFSKLDPLTRRAIAIRKTLTHSVEEARGASDAINENGDLDVFITGPVSRGVLEAMGVKVRTSLPGIHTAYVPVELIDQVAALSTVTGIRGAIKCEANLDSSIPASGISIDRGPGPTFTGINGAGI